MASVVRTHSELNAVTHSERGECGPDEGAICRGLRRVWGVFLILPAYRFRVRPIWKGEVEVRSECGADIVLFSTFSQTVISHGRESVGRELWGGVGSVGRGVHKNVIFEVSLRKLWSFEWIFGGI